MSTPSAVPYPRSATTPCGAPWFQLPVVYAGASLHLAYVGLPTDEIAARLGLPEESMPTLLAIVDAKLSSRGLTEQTERPTSEPYE